MSSFISFRKFDSFDIQVKQLLDYSTCVLLGCSLIVKMLMERLHFTLLHWMATSMSLFLCIYFCLTLIYITLLWTLAARCFLNFLLSMTTVIFCSLNFIIGVTVRRWELTLVLTFDIFKLCFFYLRWLIGLLEDCQWPYILLLCCLLVLPDLWSPSWLSEPHHKYIGGPRFQLKMHSDISPPLSSDF